MSFRLITSPTRFVSVTSFRRSRIVAHLPSPSPLIPLFSPSALHRPAIRPFSITPSLAAKKKSTSNAKMPPKKQVKDEKVLLGRPSNNLKIGVVGLPNVGKSTFFNTLTNSTSAAENYPFCTIDPEESRVAVPDARFDWLCEHFKPASKVPAFLTVIDIAGLVKGASSGEGLGNAFLSHVRSVDAIFHMVRAFDEPDVVHVEGEVNPTRDMEIIHQELRLKDIDFLTKHIELNAKAAGRQGSSATPADKAKKEELEVAQKVLDWVSSDKDVRKGEWSNKEVEVINRLLLLTAKPVIYLVNLSKKDYIRKKNKHLLAIKEWINQNNPGDLLIPFSGVFESELVDMEPAAREEELKKLGTVSGLPKIIVAGYQALQLIYFFTGGPDEVRAWTIRRLTKAPQAAGTIHTDFERGFIMAEVMRYNDLVEAGSESGVKAAGKYLMKGKDYVVDDGDIIFFKFNVTANPKK
ncbi:Obg-like ATPase [Tieghemiomyces parasiticus]|uniref:Obg-like ATPase 1 n=1 Tax=Tieghemiomyces parasiticus TaxID=78921 RepID=A0A9W8AI63_9FUNG|nr:Obg-like ATPase [Tieghemiomyces parasiticus]